jgi:hypothetical protein
MLAKPFHRKGREGRKERRFGKTASRFRYSHFRFPLRVLHGRQGATPADCSGCVMCGDVGSCRFVPNSRQQSANPFTAEDAKAAEKEGSVKQHPGFDIHISVSPFVSFMVGKEQGRSDGGAKRQKTEIPEVKLIKARFVSGASSGVKFFVNIRNLEAGRATRALSRS